MTYRKLEDCFWRINLKNFKNNRLQNMVYKIGKLYFKEVYLEYKKELEPNYASKFSLIETIDYLLNLKEQLNKKDDIEKYISLKKMIDNCN